MEYKSELIEVPFTFSITEKKKTYSRIECGIPKDKFVLAMVGNRLDADVSKEFIDILKALDNIFVVMWLQQQVKSFALMTTIQ